MAAGKTPQSSFPKGSWQVFRIMPVMMHTVLDDQDCGQRIATGAYVLHAHIRGCAAVP